MREYLIKRFVLLIPTFIGITLVVYAVLLLLPGDPVDVLLGQEYDPAVAQRLGPSGAWTSRSWCSTPSGCGTFSRATGAGRCFHANPCSTRS